MEKVIEEKPEVLEGIKKDLVRIQYILEYVKKNRADIPLTDHKKKMWEAVAIAETCLFTYRTLILDDLMMDATSKFVKNRKKSPAKLEKIYKLHDDTEKLVKRCIKSEKKITLETLWTLKSNLNSLMRTTTPKWKKNANEFGYPFP